MFYFLSVLIVAFMARGTKSINRTNDFVSESAVFAGPSTGEEVGIGTPQNASSLSAAASSEEKSAMALRLRGRPGAIGQSDRIGLIGINNRTTLELRDQRDPKRILNNHKTVLEDVEIYRSGRHRQLLNMSKRGESHVTNTSGDLPMRIGGVKNSSGGFAYSLGWGGPPRGHRPANLSDPWKERYQNEQLEQNLDELEMYPKEELKLCRMQEQHLL
uniref:Secreted protein n=1 Tax=Globodera pallida TaxID=36090 RepID=A0A183CMW0_GLOPA